MSRVEAWAVRWRRWLAPLAAGLMALAALPAHADAEALRARYAELRARYAELRERMNASPFQRAMHIESSESGGMLQGQVYAVLDHPFSQVRQSMRDPARWCDIMILPFNTKYCHAVDDGGAERLLVRIGRKYDQPLEKAFRLNFGYRNVAAGPDFFESRLNASEGPFGTRDYRIGVAAIPLEGNKTFLQLTYSYGYGALGRMAMQGYLATAGANKVGFSTVPDGNGHPQLIRGMRGAVERNAMRYYLAIDAFLETLDVPGGQQVERRIQAWFDATERYPRQLREMDRHTYVTMKRHEHERQQTAMVQ